MYGELPKDAQVGQPVSAAEWNKVKNLALAAAKQGGVGTRSTSQGTSQHTVPLPVEMYAAVIVEGPSLYSDNRYWVQKLLARHIPASFAGSTTTSRVVFDASSTFTNDDAGDVFVVTATNLDEQFNGATTHRLPPGTPVQLFALPLGDGVAFFFWKNPEDEFWGELGGRTATDTRTEVTLADLAEGDIVTITVTDTNENTQQLQYEVSAGQTEAEIAEAIAGLIEEAEGLFDDVTATSGGDIIVTNSTNGSTITASVSGSGSAASCSNEFKWSYPFTEKLPDGEGWTDGARSGTALNTAEANNDGSGYEGNNIGVTGCSGNEDKIWLSPADRGNPIVRIKATLDVNGEWVYRFYAPNGVEVQCATTGST